MASPSRSISASIKGDLQVGNNIGAVAGARGGAIPEITSATQWRLSSLSLTLALLILYVTSGTPIKIVTHPQIRRARRGAIVSNKT